MKFKFETGEIIECVDEAIVKLLLADKRYTEVKEATPKVKGKNAKGDESDDKVQK